MTPICQKKDLPLGSSTTCRLESLEPCSLSPSQVAGQPSSDGGRQGRTGNLGYQCIMRHCIKGSRQVYGHTHCTVWWFPLVEACLNVCCKLEEGRCSRVSGSEAVLITCNCRLTISHILVDCIEYDFFRLILFENNFTLTDIFNNVSPNKIISFIKRAGLYNTL